MKIESTENRIVITVDKKENYTLDELRQKLINFLFKNIGKLDDYSMKVDLMEYLIRNDKCNSSINEDNCI